MNKYQTSLGKHFLIVSISLLIALSNIASLKGLREKPFEKKMFLYHVGPDRRALVRLDTRAEDDVHQEIASFAMLQLLFFFSPYFDQRGMGKPANLDGEGI